jgi:HK97 family phage major capsid protein
MDKTLTLEDVKGILEPGLKEIKTGIEGIGNRLKAVEDKQKAEDDAKAKAAEEKKKDDDERAKVRQDLDTFKRSYGSLRKSQSMTLRAPGRISIECAEFLGAAFVLGNAKAGRLDMLDENVRSKLFDKSKGILGLEAKAALTTTDIPLPVEYFAQVRELISEFGVIRRVMFPFPLGMGTAKPPRFKTRPSFGSIAMSAAFTEKSPQIDFASLESHKLGGIVRVPREIDEQSIVPMGQFLARYGAVEFARAEDTWGFLADGTATYESVVGVDKVARTNTKTLVLAAGKTSPSDVTKLNVRNLRTKVNKAALSAGRSAYYMDSTWETRLGEFNTQAEPYLYQRLPDGSAKLDGYPVVWTDVLQPYTEAAAADATLMIFGSMEYWWFAEHGQPRMDFSSDVYFTTDELATRFIEEIDFDYQQVDVTASLITAAA